jgi:GNAT superfamily N-acetyltransferase
VEQARRAVASDIGALSELWERAVTELDGQRGGPLLAGTLARPDIHGELSSALHGDDRLLVVGLIDDVAVGLASVVCVTDRREPVGHLELVYVEPDARQVGVGEAMVNLVLEWCRARGCVGIDAPALPGNRAAKAFFEAHGFLARLLVMHFPLGDAP